MYFVDEKYIIGLQAGKHSRQIPGLSSTGPEVILKPTPSSLAMILLSVVFSQSGRAVKQHMVQRLATQAGSFHKYAQIVHHLCPAR